MYTLCIDCTHFLPFTIRRRRRCDCDGSGDIHSSREFLSQRERESDILALSHTLLFIKFVRSMREVKQRATNGRSRNEMAVKYWDLGWRRKCDAGEVCVYVWVGKEGRNYSVKQVPRKPKEIAIIFLQANNQCGTWTLCDMDLMAHILLLKGIFMSFDETPLFFLSVCIRAPRCIIILYEQELIVHARVCTCLLSFVVCLHECKRETKRGRERERVFRMYFIHMLFLKTT